MRLDRCTHPGRNPEQRRSKLHCLAVTVDMRRIRRFLPAICLRASIAETLEKQGTGSIHWASMLIGSQQHVVHGTLMCYRRTTECARNIILEIQLDTLKKRRIRGKCTNYRNLLRLAHQMPEKRLRKMSSSARIEMIPGDELPETKLTICQNPHCHQACAVPASLEPPHRCQQFPQSLIAPGVGGNEFFLLEHLQ